MVCEASSHSGIQGRKKRESDDCEQEMKNRQLEGDGKRERKVGSFINVTAFAVLSMKRPSLIGIIKCVRIS